MTHLNFKKAELFKQFGGIVLLNKHSGPSSQWMLTQLRRRFGLKKIGHGGTLDPLAQGLLVCAIAEATKFLSYSTLNCKIYDVIAQLGLTSETEDRLGHHITASASFEAIDNISSNDILNALHTFKGMQLQRPPNYSALKHNGQCRYVYARRGEEIPQAKERSIVIEAIDCFFYNQKQHKVSFRVQCSSGTYVRSLVRDLGERLNCGALLMELTRVAAAPFDIKHAYPLEQLLQMSAEEFFSTAICPIEVLCQRLPKAQASFDQVSDLCLGRDVFWPNEKQESNKFFSIKNGRYDVAVFEQDSQLFCGVGEIEPETERLYPKRWISNFLERKAQAIKT